MFQYSNGIEDGFRLLFNNNIIKDSTKLKELDVIDDSTFFLIKDEAQTEKYSNDSST